MKYYHVRYNQMNNSVDVTSMSDITQDNYRFRIYCDQVEDELITTLASQGDLNALAIDYPWDYVRMALDGEFQAWIDSIDSNEVF